MKSASIVAAVALVIAAISIWMNIDWKKTYEDCDKKKQDCYKVCRATWDAERAITNKELERLDSLENVWNSDTFPPIVSLNFYRLRKNLDNQRVDNLIKYLKCKEACEEAWEDCVGED